MNPLTLALATFTAAFWLWVVVMLVMAARDALRAIRTIEQRRS